MLSIVTLGIYSAWATVRTRRYFYGNTLVADTGLDYHASPIAILKGRIAALAIAVTFTLTTQFLPFLGLALFIPLLIATPFIMVRALRFRAAMSSWRGIRFDFQGDVPGAFGAYVGWPLLGLVTIGLAMPYAWFRSARYGVNGHRFGKASIGLSATPGDFYVLGALLAFLWFALAFLMILIGGFITLGETGSNDLTIAASAFILVGYSLVGAFIYALYSGWRFQLLYQNLAVGDARVHNSLSVARYLWIVVTNLIGLVATLGFFYPWARTRTTGYLVRSLRLEASDINGFAASAQRREHAFGEELGQALDMNIGI